ncbi:MAG: hypothetical protein ABJB10_10460 [Mesorhizobium sp.]
MTGQWLGLLTGVFGAAVASFVVVAPSKAATLSDLNVDSLPEKVAAQILDWDSTCKGDGVESTFNDDFLKRIDIDRDGDDDFILNADGMMCSNGARGGGRDGTTFQVFMTTPSGAILAIDEIVQGAIIKSFKGYAVAAIEREGSTDGWIVVERFKLRNGHVSKISRMPHGGSIAYELSRR